MVTFLTAGVLVADLLPGDMKKSGIAIHNRLFRESCAPMLESLVLI